MAQAEVEVVKAITLTLAEEEAQFLADVLGYVGGNPDFSRRAYAKELIRVLREAGIEGAHCDDVRDALDGETPVIHFLNITN